MNCFQINRNEIDLHHNSIHFIDYPFNSLLFSNFIEFLGLVWDRNMPTESLKEINLWMKVKEMRFNSPGQTKHSPKGSYPSYYFFFHFFFFYGMAIGMNNFWIEMMKKKMINFLELRKTKRSFWSNHISPLYWQFQKNV